MLVQIAQAWDCACQDVFFFNNSVRHRAVPNIHHRPDRVTIGQAAHGVTANLPPVSLFIPQQLIGDYFHRDAFKPAFNFSWDGK
jgi:hypothetical protein